MLNDQTKIGDNTKQNDNARCLPKYMKFMEANSGLTSSSLQAGVGCIYSAMNLDIPRITPITRPRNNAIGYSFSSV
jgi:hypothetical protein